LKARLTVVNGVVIENDLAKAAPFSPSVQEQVSIDGCGRKFVLNDSRIEVSNIHSLQLFFFVQTKRFQFDDHKDY
jgi:hypothetical protein